MKKLLMVVLLAFGVILSGCSTTYKAHEESVKGAQAQLIEAEKQKVAAKQAVATAKIARANAIAQLAQGGSDAVKVAAVMAIAFEGVTEDMAAAGSGAQSAQLQMPVVQPLPSLAERLFVKTFDAVVGLAPFALQGYMAHVNSETQIAMSADNSRVMTSAFGTNATIAAAGFGTASTIAGFVQAPAANLTLSGTGVLGSGTYTGPVTNTTNRTCTSGTVTGTTTATSGGAAC